MERLSLTNEALIAAIESLTEEIKGSSGQQATELYEKQMARLNEAEAHTREQMQRSASAYSNGLWGIGGKKVLQQKNRRCRGGNDWHRISEVVGRTIDEAADFWNLSSEEMAKVAREAPDLYAKIKGLCRCGLRMPPGIWTTISLSPNSEGVGTGLLREYHAGLLRQRV